MKVRDFFNVSIDTAKLLGTLFPIVAVALSLKSLLTVEQVPQALAAWMGTVVSDPVTFLIAVIIILLLVGCFIDVISAILILAPLLLGVAETYGINPIHFGIIMVITLEIGFLTPPMGLNLIVAMTAFREPFGLICKSVLPFIVLIFGVLLIVTFVPEISLWLIRPWTVLRFDMSDWISIKPVWHWASVSTFKANEERAISLALFCYSSWAAEVRDIWGAPQLLDRFGDDLSYSPGLLIGFTHHVRYAAKTVETVGNIGMLRP
jgi:hypothetical protein